MKNGICPKCNSSEIYAGMKWFLKLTSATIIPIALGISAKREYFVCARCGYVESYITDSSMLDEIRKRWLKIKPVGQR